MADDTTDSRDGERQSSGSGHNGSRRGWLATSVVLLGFVLGGVGLTFGPRALLWIGAGIIVIGGATGLATHVWTDSGRVD